MKRMMFAAVAAAAMALASCATLPTAAQIAPAVDRAQAAYNRVASAAAILLPYLSPERAARVRLALSVAERGLVAARYAATVAEARAGLEQAQTALVTVEAVTR